MSNIKEVNVDGVTHSLIQPRTSGIMYVEWDPAFVGLGLTTNKAGEYLKYGNSGSGNTLIGRASPSDDGTHFLCKVTAKYQIMIVCKCNTTGTASATVNLYVNNKNMGSFISTSKEYEIKNFPEIVINKGEVFRLKVESISSGTFQKTAFVIRPTKL